jgi:hypothetical protein
VTRLHTHERYRRMTKEKANSASRYDLLRTSGMAKKSSLRKSTRTSNRMTVYNQINAYVDDIEKSSKKDWSLLKKKWNKAKQLDGAGFANKIILSQTNSYSSRNRFPCYLKYINCLTGLKSGKVDESIETKSKLDNFKLNLGSLSNDYTQCTAPLKSSRD